MEETKELDLYKIKYISLNQTQIPSQWWEEAMRWVGCQLKIIIHLTKEYNQIRILT